MPSYSCKIAAIRPVPVKLNSYQIRSSNIISLHDPSSLALLPIFLKATRSAITSNSTAVPFPVLVHLGIPLLLLRGNDLPKPVLLAPGQIDGRGPALGDGLGHEDVLDAGARRLEHGLRQQPLAHRPQPPRPRPHAQRALRHFPQRAPREAQFDAAELEELLVLLDHAVPRLRQDSDQRVLVEGRQSGRDGDAAYEFGYQAVGLQVCGFDEIERVVFGQGGLVGRLGCEEREMFFKQLAFF